MFLLLFHIVCCLYGTFLENEENPSINIDDGNQRSWIGGIFIAYNPENSSIMFSHLLFGSTSLSFTNGSSSPHKKLIDAQRFQGFLLTIKSHDKILWMGHSFVWVISIIKVNSRFLKHLFNPTFWFKQIKTADCARKKTAFKWFSYCSVIANGNDIIKLFTLKYLMIVRSSSCICMSLFNIHRKSNIWKELSVIFTFKRFFV